MVTNERTDQVSTSSLSKLLFPAVVLPEESLRRFKRDEPSFPISFQEVQG